MFSEKHNHRKKYSSSFEMKYTLINMIFYKDYQLFFILMTVTGILANEITI